MYRRCVIIFPLIAILLVIMLMGGTCLADQHTTDQDTVSHQEWSPSPTGAAFRSLLFPGWGQSYVHSPLKAVIYGGIEQGLIYSIHRQNRLFRYYKDQEQDEFADSYKNNRNRLTWYLAGTIILSMLDAYVDAHLYHFDVSDDLSSRDGFLGT
ncbi:MAG: DUF5683 domain-containing protein [Candidatus Electryoneaceae bacterium]|nr:DUF5683 domain-containing protein [Candidatus Electryoneaceae bacterium]